MQHLYAGVILTHLSEGTVKLAVILLYKRIFSTAGFRLAANILISIIIGWILGATLVFIPSDWILHFAKYTADASLLSLARQSLVRRGLSLYS